MATVTIHYTNGNSRSFETFDQKVIARYEGYAFTDPEIASVQVQD
jgi:hypothetical protein